jgi:hypothetical protein
VAGHGDAQMFGRPASRSGLGSEALSFPQFGDGFGEPGKAHKKRYLDIRYVRHG